MVVFEGDDAGRVVDAFAAANKLSEEKKRKLMKVVQEQMAVILPRIEEGDEDIDGARSSTGAKKIDRLQQEGEEQRGSNASSVNAPDI